MGRAKRAGSDGDLTSRRLGVLISGRGSNLIAILDHIQAGRLDAQVAVVVCNVPEAAGASAARARGVDTLIVDHRNSDTREAHDRTMARALEERQVDLVCLAGYMRLLSPWFVGRFRHRLLNIHPSLLPAFPGVVAQRSALQHGVRVSGCTVHFVDETMDSGPIILQEAVEVFDDDTSESLAERILEAEHRTYVRAIDLFFSGRLRVEGRRVFGSGARKRR
jgi:phosphoribosylglycinamide formyltransferase-1